jgi:FKBP-type peptidyl-prolyl cis-trans isomerase
MGDFIEVRFVAHAYDTCELLDVTALDESYSFQLGRHDVIEGWEKGLMGACEGQTRRLTIPAFLAYGAEGISVDSFSVPPGAALIYTVEVLHVTKDELPSATVPGTPEIEARLKKHARMKKHNSKVVAPRTSKQREKNMRKTNHPKSQEGLLKKHKRREKRLMRREMRKRRLGSDQQDSSI